MIRTIGTLCLIIFASGSLTAESLFEGVWCDSTPSTFVSVEKLPNGRFFLIESTKGRDNQPRWTSAIGTVKDGKLVAAFRGAELSFDYAKDKNGRESIILTSIKNPDYDLALIRVADQILKKLEVEVQAQR